MQKKKKKKKHTDPQLMKRRIRKLKKLFEPNCYDNSRDPLLYIINSAITDIIANGDLIMSQFHFLHLRSQLVALKPSVALGFNSIVFFRILLIWPIFFLASDHRQVYFFEHSLITGTKHSKK